MINTGQNNQHCRHIYLFGCLAVGLFALITAGWAVNPVWAAEGQAGHIKLHEDLVGLKKKLEQQVKKTKDPARISVEALKVTALIWCSTAGHLAEDKGDETKIDWAKKQTDFEQGWAKTKAWDQRELLALELYYEALSSVALARAAGGPSDALSELHDIADRVEAKIKALEDDAPVKQLERKVILTSAVALTYSALIKIESGNINFTQPLDQVLKLMVSKAETINARTDIHYQAKISLLYLNYVEGANRLMFLLAHAAGPDFSGDLKPLFESLKRHQQPDSDLLTSLSLNWVVQAQASFPLAFWLADSDVKKNAK